MPAIAEFKTPDGRPVFVELEPSPATGMQPVSRGGGVHRVQRDLIEVLSDVKPLMQAVVDAVDAAVTNVDKVTAKFGFKLSVSGTVVLTSGSAEGHFEVALEWKPRSPKP